MIIEKGATVAATLYKDGVLVGRDIKFTLPAVTHKTQTITAMGEIELPLIGQIEAMSATATKQGFSPELAALAEPVATDLEVRWVQTDTTADGTAKAQGCRAYLRACAKTLPGGDITPGETTETAVEFGVTRYQLFADGKEICLIDQIKQQLRINGKDYAEDLRSLI